MNTKPRDAVQWLCAEAIIFTLAGLALWGALVARDGNVEGIYPWQLLKLRYLLLTSSAWLAFVGVAGPVSYLLLGPVAGS